MSAVFPKIAHGAGLAVLFPAWIMFAKELNRPTFDRWAREVWQAPTVEEGVALMRRTFQGWGAPITLGDLGVTASDIPTVAATAMKVGILGNLKVLTQNDVEAILRLAL